MDKPSELKGKYYFHDKNGQPTIEVSNFLMENPYLIAGRDPKRMIIARNEHDEEIVFTITSRDFVNVQQFKALIEGKGNFIWFGSSQQLAIVKSGLFMDSKTASEIEYLGYNPEFDVYAFSNGVVNGSGKFTPSDENGFCKVGDKCYFLPYESKINDEDNTFDNFRKFRHSLNKEVSWNKWSKLFVEVYGDNGAIAISFILAAIFRDVIYEHLRFFPHFFLFGKPQTGKSAMSESLQYLFGWPQSVINLGAGSTAVGSFRKLEQFSNSIVAFNEYKNDLDQKIIGMLKAAYDNQGRETGVMSNDNRTKSSKVRSALVIAGQDIPTNDAALFSRIISITFNKKVDEYNDQEKEKFEQLKSLQMGGLTDVLVELLRQRKHFKEVFPKYHSNVVKELKRRFSTSGSTERSILNYAIPIAAYKIFNERNYMMPYSEDRFLAAVYPYFEEYLGLLNASTDISNFWDAFNYLMQKNRIAFDIDYTIKINSETQEECICIRWGNVYPEYRKYMIEQRNPPLGNHTLLEYLRSSKEFVKHCSTAFRDVTLKAHWFRYASIKPNE